MSEFLEKILGVVKVVTMYLAGAIDYIEKALLYAKPIVEWIKDKMDELQPRIDDPNDPMAGDDARELIAEEGVLKWHGSGSFVTKGWIRTVVESLHMIREAARIGKDPYIDMEELGASKGYLKSKDLEIARKVWPGFQPLD